MTPTGSCPWTLSLNESFVGISWAPNGLLAAAATSEGRIYIVDILSGKLLRELPGHEGGVFEISWHPKEALVASVGQDGQVRVCQPETGEPVAELPGGSAWVEHVAWSPDGDWLAATAGRQLTLWNRSQGIVHRLNQHPSTLSALAWRADGQRISVAYYGGISIYNPHKGVGTDTLAWQSSLISLAWSPNKKWIVAGTQEMAVQVWQLPHRPGTEMAMSGFEAKVRSLSWSFNGRFLATPSLSNLMIWDCGGNGPRGTEPIILDGHDARIHTVAYQHKGELLASGDDSGRVLVWRPNQSETPIREFEVDGSVQQIVWDPASQKLLAGTKSGILTLLPVTRP